MSTFSRIGLVGRPGHTGVVDSLLRLLKFLATRDVQVILDEKTATLLPAQHLEISPRASLSMNCDLLIVVGSELGDSDLWGGTVEARAMVRIDVEGAEVIVPRRVEHEHPSGRRADEAAVVGGAEALVGVHRDLLRAARPAELVDARVLGDLVDPRLEGDGAVGVAHAAQRGHEDVLGDVLRPGVVVDHALDVGADPPVVAAVEPFEGPVVTRAHPRDGVAPDEARLLLAAPAQAGLDRAALLHEVVAVEVEADLEAQRVAGAETARPHSAREHAVPQLRGVLRHRQQLAPLLARVARAVHHHLDAVDVLHRLDDLLVVVLARGVNCNVTDEKVLPDADDVDALDVTARPTDRGGDLA